jgi:hypothetical protein
MKWNVTRRIISKIHSYYSHVVKYFLYLSKVVYLQFLGMSFAILGHFCFVFQPMFEYYTVQEPWQIYLVIMAPILWTIGMMLQSSTLLIFCVPMSWLIALLQVFKRAEARLNMNASYMLWLSFILIVYLLLFLKIIRLRNTLITSADHSEIKTIVQQVTPSTEPSSALYHSNIAFRSKSTVTSHEKSSIFYHFILTRSILHGVTLLTGLFKSLSDLQKLLIYWFFTIPWLQWWCFNEYLNLDIQQKKSITTYMDEILSFVTVLSLIILIYSILKPIIYAHRTLSTYPIKRPKFYDILLFVVGSLVLVYAFFRI